MVTLQIIDMLKDAYEIHIIPFAPVNPSKFTYNIPDNVIIENINYPGEISQFDINFKKHYQNHNYFKALGLFFKTIHTYTFGRKKYIKKIRSLTTKNDIIICSCIELMAFALKDRFVIQHFHFNSKIYRNLISTFFRITARKPDLYLFISEATEKAVNKKGKLKTATILNPCRFSQQKNFVYNNNTLISACRFETQKDPMLMLKIAKELDNRNFKYTYNIYGDGSYLNQMNNYIKKYKLKNLHIVKGEKDLQKFYSQSDLHILTSRFEGLPLTAIEANTLSIPTIWMEMGDPTSSFMIEGKNGYVIRERDPKVFADKITDLLSNKDKLLELKKSTYESSKRFVPNNIKVQWIELLDNCFDDLK